MECRKIEALFEDGFDGHNHEFTIYATNDKKEISKKDSRTVILVSDKNDIQKAFDSITYTNVYSGFITVVLWDLYERFNNSGVWNYKHIKTKNYETLKEEFNNIISFDLFVVFWCNPNNYPDELIALLEIISKNNTNPNLSNFFSMPVITDIPSEEYEVGIFYR